MMVGPLPVPLNTPPQFPIRGNAPSNYRTPAVHRAEPPPRMDCNSDCWYSKKKTIIAIHQTSPAPSKAINPEERSARPFPISDQRICSLQHCPGLCESENLSITPSGRLAASLRLHVASVAVLFHHGCACLSVFQSSGSGSKLYQPPSFLFFCFRCEFLLSGGRQRHPSSAARSIQPPRLRIPPTWTPPTSSIPSSQITPATIS